MIAVFDLQFLIGSDYNSYNEIHPRKAVTTETFKKRSNLNATRF